MMTTTRKPTALHPVKARMSLSVIIPVFNEEAVLAEFHNRLCASIERVPGPNEIIYVNDGSSDASGKFLAIAAGSDARVTVITLSRNFGKEAAMTAGLDHSCGLAIIVIDADLQDPPEQIPRMHDEWKQGADVVLMQRASRAGDSWLKQATASMFYTALGRLSNINVRPDVGDFRLLSRRAVDALLACRERTRFMKGLYSWVGFRQVILRYDRERRFAGKTKWNYWRLWNLALEGITSFSTAPLKVASYVGFFTALGAFVLGAKVLIKTLLYGDPVRGFTTLSLIILFLGGVQLIGLGIIGEYLARVFVEVKQRPLYLVDNVLNVETTEAESRMNAVAKAEIRGF
jgi:polyisoprenyl-phosphate glycosyltransferase